jgi:hypothetical protein
LAGSLPPGVAEQVAGVEGENLVLWTTLHASVPLTPTQLAYWLFALDTDADLATGRPVGDGAVNPDLGAEVTVGVYSDPANDVRFAPYLLVWDAELGDMAREPFPMTVAFTPDRKTVILVLPRDPLAELIGTRAGAEADWELLRGRAATLAGTESGLVVDFCPDLP